MNQDERMEALTQSVELLSGMHQQTERVLQEFIKVTNEGMQLMVRLLADHDKRIRQIEQ